MAKRILETGGLLFAAVTLSLSATATSSDDTQGVARPPQFSVYDADGDGYLSREEYEIFYREFEGRHRKVGRPAHCLLRIMSFEQIDTDGDDRVSLDEMVSALRERRQGPGWRWKRETS